MEVRFPTYSLRELQRAGSGRQDEPEDSFIQVIGKLSADGDPDPSHRSRQAPTPEEQERSEEEETPRRPLRSVMGADAIVAALGGRAAEEAEMAFVPVIGGALDVLA